jgi:hypothetical protein
MPWRCIRQWTYSSTILDLGIRCEWVISFTTQPLYIPGQSPWYPFHKKLGEPQSCSGVDEKRKSPVSAGNQTLAIQPIARCYTDCTILVWRLQGSLNYILAFFFCVQNYGHDNGTTFITVFSLRNRIVLLLYSHTLNRFIALIMGMTFYLNLGFLHLRRP